MRAPRTSGRRLSRKQEVHGVDCACLHKAAGLAVAQTGEPRDAALSHSIGRCRRDKKWDAFVQSGLGNAVAMSNPIFFVGSDL
jgi:hypothetical protein